MKVRKFVNIFLGMKQGKLSDLQVLFSEQGRGRTSDTGRCYYETKRLLLFSAIIQFSADLCMHQGIQHIYNSRNSDHNRLDHRSKDFTYYKIQFEYEVDGKLLEGTKITSSENLKVGNTIKILRNSEKSEKFTIKNREEMKSSLIGNLLGELLCILLIYQVLYGKLHSMLNGL